MAEKSASQKNKTAGQTTRKEASSYRSRKLREGDRSRREKISTAKDISFILIVGVCLLMTASWVAADLLWLKDLTYRGFGILLYLLPFILSVASWFLLFRPFTGKTAAWLAALFLILFAVSGLISLTASEPAGGLLGKLNLKLCLKGLGKAGTWVVNLVIIAIGVLLATGFRIGERIAERNEQAEVMRQRAEQEERKAREQEMAREKREQIKKNIELRHLQNRQRDVEKWIDKNRTLEADIEEKDRYIKENRDRFSPVFGIGDTTITEGETSPEGFGKTGDGELRPEDFLKPKKKDTGTRIPDFLVDSASRGKRTKYVVSGSQDDDPVFPVSDTAPEKVVIPGFPGEATAAAKKTSRPAFTIRGLSGEAGAKEAGTGDTGTKPDTAVKEKDSAKGSARGTSSKSAVGSEARTSAAQKTPSVTEEDPYRRQEDRYVKTIITSSGRIITREVAGDLPPAREQPRIASSEQNSVYSSETGSRSTAVNAPVPDEIVDALPAAEEDDSDMRTSLPERTSSSYGLPESAKSIPVAETVYEEPEPVSGEVPFDVDEVNAAADSKPFEPVPDEIPENGRPAPSVKAGKASAKAEDTAPENIEIDTEAGHDYIFPPLDLLKKGSSAGVSKNTMESELMETAGKLESTLKTFGVGVRVTDVSCGPTVTRYEIQPDVGVKVSRIVNLTDDIKLNLAAADIRIEAPIPGKSAIGIEIPNKVKKSVVLRDLLESDAFTKSKSKLAFAAGRDIEGNTVIADIAKMPHVLVAGATGSGKSVCINTIIMSILYHALPTEVKLIMIDPKQVELSVYNGIPHLLLPVVTDPKKAAAALNWAVAEMENRYQLFAKYSVRSFEGFNELVDLDSPEDDVGNPIPKMPQILILVDELADLMMTSGNDVENAICRLAQKARAAGIHIVLATQRPSVDVLTGLIKANIPSRIAFAVSSGTDSRTILDMTGAESLLGAGDMLYAPAGVAKPRRVQGSFVSDGEVKATVDFITGQGKVKGAESTSQQTPIDLNSVSGSTGGSSERDEYYADSGRLVIEKEKASIGMLQRAFKLGFNRAARIVDQLAADGVVGEEEGTKPRRVLMTPDEFEEFLKTIGE